MAHWRSGALLAIGAACLIWRQHAECKLLFGFMNRLLWVPLARSAAGLAVVSVIPNVQVRSRSDARCGWLMYLLATVVLFSGILDPALLV